MFDWFCIQSKIFKVFFSIIKTIQGLLECLNFNAILRQRGKAVKSEDSMLQQERIRTLITKDHGKH